MKKIFTYTSLLILTWLAGCQKENVATQTIESKQLSWVVGAEEVAKIIAGFTDNRAITNEIFNAVTARMELIDDEHIALDALEKTPNSFNAVLQQAIKEKAPELAVFLATNDLEIYWPYSVKWDKTTAPTVSFTPLVNRKEGIGYVKEPDGLKQVLVNEAYSEKKPVWIIKEKEVLISPEQEAIQQNTNTRVAKTQVQTSIGTAIITRVDVAKAYLFADYLYNPLMERVLSFGMQRPNFSTSIPSGQGSVTVGTFGSYACPRSKINPNVGRFISTASVILGEVYKEDAFNKVYGVKQGTCTNPKANDQCDSFVITTQIQVLTQGNLKKISIIPKISGKNGGSLNVNWQYEKPNVFNMTVENTIKNIDDDFSTPLYPGNIFRSAFLNHKQRMVNGSVTFDLFILPN